MQLIKKQLIMSIQKQFLKSKPECKVTFSIKAKEAKKVEVAGVFNNWQAKAMPLKKLKNGTFKGSINLPTNNAYEFKYVIDGESWINDDSADKYVWNDFSASENGLLVI